MTVLTQLRERVLVASLAARERGRPTPEAASISASEALSLAAASFERLLAGLSDEDWGLPALRDLDVQGLVGHLIGVERDVQRALAGDETVADIDHIASTQDAARAQSGRPAALTREEWRGAVEDTLHAVHGGDERVISLHGMRLSVDALLVVRAFELWAHENDIRLAVGAAPSSPEPSVLALMTRLAVQLLPHAVSRTGTGAATDLHLVLTGAGGGTYDLRLGPPRGEADDLLLVVDAVDFCRLVANRVAPAELDVHLHGRGADGVLAAAASLALD